MPIILSNNHIDAIQPNKEFIHIILWKKIADIIIVNI